MNLERTNEIAARLAESKGWKPPQYLDHGASSAVYRVDLADGPVALKVYDPAFFLGANALIEARRCELQRGLKGHGHPNLIDIIDVVEYQDEKTWYLIMEFSPWNSLEKRLADVPDDKVNDLIKMLASAVIFLENFGEGFVHRDIKPANIVVSPDWTKLKLLDLGVLRPIATDEGNGTDAEGAFRFIATAQYSPPEYLVREELPGRQGFNAINVYQVGAVLHDLIMKEPLFKSEAATGNRYILHKAVVEKTPRLISRTVPARLVSLSQRALVKQPYARIAAVKISDFLAESDDRDALRRMLASRSVSALPPILSLAVWKDKIGSWVRSAARLEKPALGGAKVDEQHGNGRLRWSVRFAASTGVAFVEARRGRTITIDVVADTTPPVVTTVVEISTEGPDLAAIDIPEALAAQLLYALALSMSVEETDLKNE